MDIPADTLEQLKCNSCEVFLSRGPVYLQHDGAGVCGRCYTPKCPATRNTQYEATAKLLKFPCKNQELGCPETVPFVNEEEVIAHEEVCEHRQYVCPVLGSASCDWLGTRAAMLAHCRDQHPDNVLENPCTLIHDNVKDSVQNYIITAFQLLFLLHTKVCVATGQIFHFIRFLGTSEEAAKYFFTLDMRRGNELLSKEGQVAPLDCQEPTTVAMDMNCLIKVLGGFDGTTFTVTVKRRVSDAADELARASEACGVCRAAVTKFSFRDKEGWRCERCLPGKQACKNQNQGCTYNDFASKRIKHMDYFCQLGTQCVLCNTTVSRDTLATHYTSNHQDITNRAGSTWWVKKTDYWQHRLIHSSAAGTAICMYWLQDFQFILRVNIPVSSERLKEFSCVVRFTDPATGNEYNVTPDVLYNFEYDWCIAITRSEFSSWNVVFDVSVDIIKI